MSNSLQQIDGFPMFRITFEGLAPLMMSNERMANPFDQYAMRLKNLNKKKKQKGIDEYAVMTEMAEVEFLGGLYWDENLGPYLTAEQIKTCIQEGAKLGKKGKDVARALIVPESRVKLEYQGPRDLEGLKNDKSYWDQRLVRVGTARVLRTRPIFHSWSATTTIGFVPSAMNFADMTRYIRDAGLLCGLCEGRGKFNFGRFRIAAVNGQTVTDDQIVDMINGSLAIAPINEKKSKAA